MAMFILFVDNKMQVWNHIYKVYLIELSVNICKVTRTACDNLCNIPYTWLPDNVYIVGILLPSVCGLPVITKQRGVTHTKLIGQLYKVHVYNIR